MKLCANSLLTVLLAAFGLVAAPTGAPVPPREAQGSIAPRGSCFCPQPPGGVCKCETGQNAVCTIVNNQCSGTCYNSSKAANNREVAVQLLEAILKIPRGRFGFAPDGTPQKGDFRAQASLGVLKEMLSGRQNDHQFTAQVPDALRAAQDPATRLSSPTVNVSLSTEVVEKLNQFFASSGVTLP